MAIIKNRELKNISGEELNKKLNELKLELMKEKASAYSGITKNPGKIKEIKRTIAKILTIKNKTIQNNNKKGK